MSEYPFSGVPGVSIELIALLAFEAKDHHAELDSTRRLDRPHRQQWGSTHDIECAAYGNP
jgi:hypothetical protein